MDSLFAARAVKVDWWWVEKFALSKTTSSPLAVNCRFLISCDLKSRRIHFEYRAVADWCSLAGNSGWGSLERLVWNTLAVCYRLLLPWMQNPFCWSFHGNFESASWVSHGVVWHFQSQQVITVLFAPLAWWKEADPVNSRLCLLFFLYWQEEAPS